MKHTIEIEGLPEGWELVSIKLPDNCTKQSGDTTISIHNVPGATFVLKKKQPRRITLEETNAFHEPESPDDMHTTIFQIHDNATAKMISNKKWRIVEDIGENND